jgi:putative peptide zinc metalloprotease protein
MVISGVATIVFNANPLLRYDGYYILSDLTGTPNLAQRAQEFWKFLLERYAFGVRGLRPPALRGRAEAWLLGSYWLLSFPYRVFIMLSLLVLIAPRYITLGAVLAVIAATTWAVWPMLKSIAYLAGEPRLMGRRSRAVGVSAGALGALILLIAFVPLPAAGYGSGTVEAADKGPVRPDADGFIEEVLVTAGQQVNRADPILRLRNTEIDADVARAQGVLQGAMADYDAAAAKDAPEREVALRAVEKARAELDRAKDRAAGLIVRAPVTGRICTGQGSASDLANLVGQFVQRGALIAYVESTDRLVVKALVSDLDQAYVFRGRGRTEAGPAPDISGVTATIRVRGQAGTAIPARITRTGPAGTRHLSSKALAASAGGDVLLDPTDPQQQRTIVAQFMVEVEPGETEVHLKPGQRAKVRLGITPEPLLEQLWRRVQQYLTSRRAA